VPVTVVDGSNKTLVTAGTFTETTQIAKIDTLEGVAGAAVKITGASIPASQGADGVTFGGAQATVIKWDNTGIAVNAPDLHVTASTPEPVLVLDGSGKTIANAGPFIEDPLVTVSPAIGYAGTTLTITGGKMIPTTQGSDSVVFSDAKTPSPVVGSVSKWDNTGITVTAPNLHRPASDPVTVAVVDATGKPVPQTTATFTESPAKWGDQDTSLKFVGGYEQGYQSSQQGSSDAFLAAYGSKLLTLKWDPSADNALNAKFGVFYAIRLQTAPLASGTYNVVSSVSTATGSQFTQNIQSVGAAVDLSLGFEYQLKQKMVPSSFTFGVIGGSGFVTPLQANSVNATYLMPSFGTVECTELQSRLKPVLSQSQYAGITANTTATTGSPCFTNNIGVAAGGTGTPMTQLEYSAPDQPNFFPKYFLGMRAVKRYAGSSGKPVCDDDDPCERGYIDFTLGQNASISGGSLKHLLFNVDSIYPLRVPGVNFLYLFGSVSKRIWNLPPTQSPLVLQAGTASTTPGPNPAYMVIPLTQPDRDFYRIGVGVSLCQIFGALTSASVPCKF